MQIVDWGLIDFNEAWRRQRELSDAIFHDDAPDTLVFCEHPDVITVGRRTPEGSILVPPHELQERGVQLVDIDRGGEATVHNPGQLVGYPVFNLQRTKADLHWFLRTIEQAIIDALAVHGVASGRVDGLTGVWVENSRKVCAIGIHCSRWITTHGFALNVSNDLSLFADIIPCGIRDRGVTSLLQEADPAPSMGDVKASVSKAFHEHFVVAFS